MSVRPAFYSHPGSLCATTTCSPTRLTSGATEAFIAAFGARSMQDPASELPRMLFPRTRLNKGPEGGRSPRSRLPSCPVASDAALLYRMMGFQSGSTSLFRLKVICCGPPLSSAFLMNSSSSPVGLSTPGPVVRSLEKAILPPPGEKTG